MDPITIQPEVIEPDKPLWRGGCILLRREIGGYIQYPVDDPWLSAYYGATVFTMDSIIITIRVVTLTFAG